MVTSGGAPEILSPTAGQTVTFLTVTWAEVENAVSYEVWVAELGVDFTAINVSGIVGDTFTHPDPLNTSTYRVWVRALLTDGTFGPWSNPVTFQGGIVVQDESTLNEQAPLLASVDIDLSDDEVASTQKPQTAQQPAWQPEEAIPVEPEDAAFGMPSEPAALQNVAPVPMQQQPVIDALTQIAQNCVDTEWWEASEKSA